MESRYVISTSKVVQSPCIPLSGKIPRPLHSSFTGCQSLLRKVAHRSTTDSSTGLQKLQQQKARRRFSECNALASEIETVESKDSAAQKFVWDKIWYPAASLSCLDPKIPESLTILGRPMVVWFDKNTSEWQIFHDLCPHRLAPLSEGRIHESGQLQCSYHGWTFAADGSCGLIPQADKDSKITSSPRACARKYPTMAHQGILWVWPDFSPTAAAEAAVAPPPPTYPHFNDPSFADTDREKAFGCSEVHYGGEILLENLLDPAHVPFAHHGIQGNRNKAGPTILQVKELAVDGIRGTLNTEGSLTFSPPCSIRIEFPVRFPQPSPMMRLMGISADDGSSPSNGKKKENRIVAILHCVPTLPGRSRLLACFCNNFAPKFVKNMPKWLQHQTTIAVLNSDHLLLHLAEKRLLEEGGSNKTPELYYVPTAADAFVSAFRIWLKRFASGGVQYPDYVENKLPETPSKRVMLDRQRMHVRFCKSCRDAQKNLEKLKLTLWAASFASLLLLACAPVIAAVLNRALTVKFAGILALIAAAFAAAANSVSTFITRAYFFQDFVHALND